MAAAPAPRPMPYEGRPDDHDPRPRQRVGAARTVTAIAPGVIETPFHHKFTPPAVLESFRSAIPLGLGKPEDVAWAAFYLVSQMGGYITGETMEVNGGQIMV